MVADIPLYALATVAGIVGTVWGNGMSRRLNPAAFRALLSAMVVLCCALMTVSGLGLV